jgi:hypothetical protein
MQTFIVIASLFLLIGCSSTGGTFKEKTHFTYPNSNVHPLKHFTVTRSKESWIIPPTLSREEMLELLNEILDKESGSDLLINYQIDSKNTNYMIYHTLDITFQGTAVKMEIGDQELR